MTQKWSEKRVFPDHQPHCDLIKHVLKKVTHSWLCSGILHWNKKNLSCSENWNVFKCYLWPHSCWRETGETHQSEVRSRRRCSKARYSPHRNVSFSKKACWCSNSSFCGTGSIFDPPFWKKLEAEFKEKAKIANNKCRKREKAKGHYNRFIG